MTTLGIIGAVALMLGIWALVSWWWFVVEVIQALIALILVIGGITAIAISIRQRCRPKASAEKASAEKASAEEQ